MVLYQLSTVQFPNHQFVWKVCSVQFGAWGLSASVQFIHFISRILPALTRIDLAGSFRLRSDSVNRVSNCLGEADEQFLVPSSGNPSQSARGFVAYVERWCALLTVLACLSGVWCVVGVTQFQFKIVLKEFVQFSSPT